jgi:two-component system LytT family sensor kinase
MEFSQILTYAPLTPFAYLLAMRFPIQRGNWIKRALLHLGFGLAFTVGHIILKAATPYGYWDPSIHDWTAALWNPQIHALRFSWDVLQGMFLGSVVDDVFSAYVPIVLVAHAISYYQRSQQGEVRAAQLESQLATARLQTLKSQLQPHFLFNTMHSISALMLTNVQAADHMICRLSDLLRLSLETAGTQITTVRRELEFVNCYLEIEKVRFEERLRVVHNIAPETLDAEIPHLLLQPIVDNAVKHGISKLLEGGEIRISSVRHEAKLQIEIANSGPAPRLTPGMRNGIGLKITRERLESLYGTNQTLELVHSPHGMIVARVCIPFAVHSGQTIGVEPNPGVKG